MTFSFLLAKLAEKHTKISRNFSFGIFSIIDTPNPKMSTIVLPPLPSADYLSEDFAVRSSVSTPDQRPLEPVGPFFLAHARRVSCPT